MMDGVKLNVSRECNKVSSGEYVQELIMRSAVCFKPGKHFRMEKPSFKENQFVKKLYLHQGLKSI